MNRLRVKLFATLREHARTAEVGLEFPEGATVAEVWRSLLERFPELAGHRGSVSYAVNHEYVRGDFRPRDNDEVAFIPPVSGGSEPPWLGPVGIVREPIDIGALESAVADPNAGAIVTFAGTTRRVNAGRRVLRLEYEAYERMALSEMRKIAVEAGRRHEIVRIGIIHRVGVVEIGETSVAITVSAAHRASAFEACRFAIDRLKQVVPIWKKEHFEGGEVWIGCQTSNPPPPG